jgi:hypothetical protein
LLPSQTGNYDLYIVYVIGIIYHPGAYSIWWFQILCPMKQQQSDYELIFLFDVSFGSFMLRFMHLMHVRCWNVMVICIPDSNLCAILPTELEIVAGCTTSYMSRMDLSYLLSYMV